VLLYAPHAPGVNVCNSELDWGSIVSGVTKLKVEADFQVGGIPSVFDQFSYLRTGG
jgi:hypothetical protein